MVIFTLYPNAGQSGTVSLKCQHMHKEKTTKMKQARLAHSWTQQDLAFFTRMSAGDVRRIENAIMQPYPRQAQKLGTALGLDPGELQHETKPEEIGVP